ncbi:MAG: family 1 glycosylhydrolase [Anaerobutyricum sp.]
MITISHYEVPFGLTKKCNAWVSREMITYYLNYCRSIFTRYKGKAKYWIKHAITEHSNKRNCKHWIHNDRNTKQDWLIDSK